MVLKLATAIMENYNYNISLNGKQFDVNVTERAGSDKTLYDVQFADRTLTIYKNTLYTWTSDDPQEFSQADIQSVGEQIINV